jgi:hypothetical protein
VKISNECPAPLPFSTLEITYFLMRGEKLSSLHRNMETPGAIAVLWRDKSQSHPCIR